MVLLEHVCIQGGEHLTLFSEDRERRSEDVVQEYTPDPSLDMGLDAGSAGQMDLPDIFQHESGAQDIDQILFVVRSNSTAKCLDK